MNTSVTLLLLVAFIMASLWAQRRAQDGGAQAQRYRRLRVALATAALGVALFAFWGVIEDHRRADADYAPGVSGARP